MLIGGRVNLNSDTTTQGTKGSKTFLPFCGFCAFVALKGDGLFCPELEFAVFVDFGFGLQATRDVDDMLEDTLADFVDRLRSVDHSARREI